MHRNSDLGLELLQHLTGRVWPHGIDPANGDQLSAGTNGRFTVFSDNPAEYFTGIKLESSTNSFEIDNLAVAVPEPATWAMMIVGFGAAGAMIRRRRTVAA